MLLLALLMISCQYGRDEVERVKSRKATSERVSKTRLSETRARAFAITSDFRATVASRDGPRKTTS